MMKCPECGKTIEPVNHNNRGWRCPACWAKVEEPVKELEPVKKTEPPKKPAKKDAAK